MSDPMDEETRRRSEAGKAVPEKSPCPICDGLVKHSRLPEHIREIHSGDSGFPPEP